MRICWGMQFTKPPSQPKQPTRGGPSKVQAQQVYPGGKPQDCPKGRCWGDWKGMPCTNLPCNYVHYKTAKKPAAK